MTSIVSKPATTSTTTTPSAPAVLRRQRSSEEDRIALISNLPAGATELTLRHFLHGTMALKGLKVGTEPPIAKVRFLTESDEELLVASSTFSTSTTATNDDTTKTALVEFETSEDCQIAIKMLTNNGEAVDEEDLPAYHGHRLGIEKLTGTYHVDHADRNQSLRHSVNKRNGLAKYGTDYSKVDKSHLQQEVNRLEESLSLERVALTQTRDELLNEQQRQVTNDEMLVSTTLAVLNRTNESLALEQAKRASLEEKIARLENLLVEAEKEIQRLSLDPMRKAQSELQTVSPPLTEDDNNTPQSPSPLPVEKALSDRFETLPLSTKSISEPGQ